MCMRVVDKKLYHAGLLYCSKLLQLANNPKHNYAQVPAESTRCEAKMSQICTIQTSWLLCCASVLQRGICRAVHRVTDLQKNPVRISKDEADEQQAQHDTKNWERHWHPEKSANKAKTNMNAYGTNGHERKRPYTNACGKERKSKPQILVAMKNGLPNQPIMKETKRLKPPQNPKRLPTCKHKV